MMHVCMQSCRETHQCCIQTSCRPYGVDTPAKSRHDTWMQPWRVLHDDGKGHFTLNHHAVLKGLHLVAAVLWLYPVTRTGQVEQLGVYTCIQITYMSSSGCVGANTLIDTQCIHGHTTRRAALSAAAAVATKNGHQQEVGFGTQTLNTVCWVTNITFT